MAFRALRDAINTWIGVKRAMRTREQFLGGCVVFEACFEPRFVRAVLEETTHEIRHARNQFADGAILAQAKIEIDRRALELIAHAVEHLQFECRLWKTALLECCERRCDRARVVTSEREFHAAFALGRGRRCDKSRGHALEARVGVNLAAPHRNRPALLFRVDRFVIPVRAFHETNRDLAARALRPLDDAARVIVARAQVRLHCQASVEVVLLAGTHEEFERQILERELLHVEVDENAFALRGFENWAERVEQAADRAFGIDRINARRKRADFDRDVRARNRPEVIVLKTRIRAPRSDRRRKILDEIEILAAIRFGFVIAHTCFAEKIDGEAEPRIPNLLEAWKRRRSVGATDELRRHRRDLRRHRLRDNTLHQHARLQRGCDERRWCHARLCEVVGEVVVDRVVVFERWEAVDETEDLDLEGLILHRPIHQAFGPDGKDVRLRAACACQKVGSDREGPRFKRGIKRRNGATCGRRRLARCGSGSGLFRLEKQRHSGRGEYRSARSRRGRRKRVNPRETWQFVAIRGCSLGREQGWTNRVVDVDSTKNRLPYGRSVCASRWSDQNVGRAPTAASARS